MTTSDSKGNGHVYVFVGISPQLGAEKEYHFLTEDGRFRYKTDAYLLPLDGPLIAVQIGGLSPVFDLHPSANPRFHRVPTDDERIELAAYFS